MSWRGITLPTKTHYVGKLEAFNSVKKVKLV